MSAATRTRRLALAAAVAASFLVSAAPTGALGLLPPANPPANLRPVPNFLSSGPCATTGGGVGCQNPCVEVRAVGAVKSLAFPTYDNAPRCTAFLLRSLDGARASEGLGRIDLPTNWYSLSVPEQLFVLADVERVDRGLPPYLGLNKALSASAQRAAGAGADPLVAPGFAIGRNRGVVAYGSTWSSGYSPLEADYIWMYDDGWAGTSSPNRACTSSTAAGCWGHRDQLLGSDGSYNPGVGLRCAKCEMGAGFAVVGAAGAFTDLIERPAGRPPAMYFTWARDVKPFLSPASTGPLPTTTTPPVTATPMTPTTTLAG